MQDIDLEVILPVLGLSHTTKVFLVILFNSPGCMEKIFRHYPMKRWFCPNLEEGSTECNGRKCLLIALFTGMGWIIFAAIVMLVKYKN